MDGRFYATLIGLMVSLLAIWNMNFDSTCNVLENFGMNPSMTVKRMSHATTSNGTRALPTNYAHMMNSSTPILRSDATRGSGNMFQVPPNLKNRMTPRFNSGGYGAHINYNLPNNEHLGVPKHPLNFGNMATENYSSGGCTSAGSGSKEPQLSPYAPTNYDQSEIVDSLPISDMGVLGADGSDENSIIVDRMIHANQKSRLRANGDMIRGDLHIVPHNTGWFQVSATPHIDLHLGAMHVMGGLHNETAKDTSELAHVSSGGHLDTLGGVHLGEHLNIASHHVGFDSSSPQDSHEYTAFPK
jgi:hypothetical protein